MDQNETKIFLHKGVFKKEASFSEAVFMITGMTIGAGVLGIPYVVAQVGLLVGLAYIVILGIVMLFLNLLIGEIAVRTRESLQLPGFAGKYLGNWAKHLLTFTIIVSSVGALLAYIVGEGQSLAALFGGSSDWWSLFFWTVGSVIVWRGLQTVKTLEKFFSVLVIAIIAGLSFYLLPHAQTANVWYFNPAQIFLPYGVILFALHASPAIAEAHALLPGSQKRFRRALILGTIIPVILYILFAVAVVLNNGLDTTEVATIGLGQKFGPAISIFANMFAIFAMSTGFMGLGVALKQTFVWDHKISPVLATIFVVGAPITLFMLGLRSFVYILDTVGGLFIGIEALLTVLICWRARQKGDLDVSRYRLHNFWLLAVPVLLVFSLITVISLGKFIK